MFDKVELLKDLVEDSKRFEFVDDEVLKIQNYYNGKAIYVNFIGLVEVMYEKLDDEDIDRILLTDYEDEEE